MDKFNLDTFTFKLSIGALWLVSIFLFICGFYNMFPFVENLANTSIWGILMVVPTIVFSYAIGGITTYLSNTIVITSKQDFSEIEDLLIISRQNNEYINKRYEAMRCQHEFFRACIPAMIFLGFSVIWSSVLVLGKSFFVGEKIIAIVLGALTIASSIIIRKMTVKQKNEIDYLVKQLKNKHLSGKS